MWLNSTITKKKKNLISLILISLSDPFFPPLPFFTLSVSENGDLDFLGTIRMQGRLWSSALLPRLQRSAALHSPGVWNTYPRQGEFLPQNKGGMRKRERPGGAAEKQGLLLCGRWEISPVSTAGRRMAWRKWFSCWFLSHPKETFGKKSPNAQCIE